MDKYHSATPSRHQKDNEVVLAKSKLPAQHRFIDFIEIITHLRRKIKRFAWNPGVVCNLRPMPHSVVHGCWFPILWDAFNWRRCCLKSIWHNLEARGRSLEIP